MRVSGFRIWGMWMVRSRDCQSVRGCVLDHRMIKNSAPASIRYGTTIWSHSSMLIPSALTPFQPATADTGRRGRENWEVAVLYVVVRPRWGREADTVCRFWLALLVRTLRPSVPTLGLALLVRTRHAVFSLSLKIFATLGITQVNLILLSLIAKSLYCCLLTVVTTEGSI
jgi:hypothetical protein